jgi:transcriptional regulator NrdR family protein
LNEDGNLRRKRVCRTCKYRFATVEILDTEKPLMKAREPKPKVPKPETPARPKKPVAPKARVTKEKVRRFDDGDYEFGSAFEEELFDVGRELGIFK